MMSPPLVVSAGEYFTLEAFQNSGGNLDAEQDENTFFGIMESFATQRVLLALSSDQTIGTSLVHVDWEAETYDEGGFWDVGAPSRITIPGGVSLVRFFAGLRFEAGVASSHMFCNIDKNGGSFIGGGALEPEAMATTSTTRLAIASAPVAVVEGDYFEVQTRGSTSIDILADPQSYFGMEVLL